MNPRGHSKKAGKSSFYRAVVAFYIWTPYCCDGLPGDAVERFSHFFHRSSFYSVEADGADVVSEVVPRQHQASRLQATLMSSPEWLAG